MKEGFLNFNDLFFVFDLLSFQISHIKDIRNLISFGSDLGDFYIETETEKSMGDQVQKAHMIIGKDLDQTKEIGGFVVHDDSRRPGGFFVRGEEGCLRLFTQTVNERKLPRDCIF
jgi:hypothetical protein